MHLVKHPEEHVGYVGVRDSKTFQEFGEQQMSSPGPRAKLNKRVFIDMKPEEVKERKAKVEKVKTLHGIKSRFQYICLPDGKV